MNTVRTTTALAASAALATLALAAPAANAGDDGRVEKRGSCSGTTDWKLKAKHDDGRIEVEYEVDSNRNGQSWNVKIFDNGVRIFKGTRTTKAPSGSFSVELKTANRAGSDKIRATATNPRTGETCGGRVTV